MTSTQAAVARRNENQPSLATVVQRMVPEIQRALPKHMDADRMARLALTVSARTPRSSPSAPRLQSFAGALLTAAALGLEPGVNGEAYLVPYTATSAR
jgi:recombination protein RecT